MTPPTPPRDTTAGRVYNDLRNLAHRAGRDPAEYMTLYALEGFLARMIASDHARDFVLKGGVLMAAFAARRPTRDIDLAAIGLVNDIPDVEQRVRAIVTTDLADGLLFDTTSVAGEPIRDDAPYAGVRVNLTGRLSSARVVLHVDVNFGDPIWPAPTQAVLPLLLGGTLSLPGYPDHMVLAEKIVTAIDRGDQNTRWRDFVDITAITDTRTISYADLRPAIETVARYRQVEIQPLEELLTAMPDLAQRKWSTWRRKQRIDSAPEELLPTSRPLYCLRRPRPHPHRPAPHLGPRQASLVRLGPHHDPHGTAVLAVDPHADGLHDPLRRSGSASELDARENTSPLGSSSDHAPRASTVRTLRRCPGPPPRCDRSATTESLGTSPARLPLRS